MAKRCFAKRNNVKTYYLFQCKSRVEGEEAAPKRSVSVNLALQKQLTRLSQENVRFTLGWYETEENEAKASDSAATC